jgi:hypothetical protein
MAPLDEQVEAEKLRELRERIEALLHEYDACASVVLAGRGGRAEVFLVVDTSWSKLRLVKTPNGMGISLRSKGSDYDHDLPRQKRELAWSLGVASNFGTLLGMQAMAWLQVSDTFDAATGAEHTPLQRNDPRDA